MTAIAAGWGRPWDSHGPGAAPPAGGPPPAADAARLLLRTDSYELILDGDTIEVVLTPSFDVSVAPHLRSLLTLARELGMDVQARVRSRREPPSACDRGDALPTGPAVPGPGTAIGGPFADSRPDGPPGAGRT